MGCQFGGMAGRSPRYLWEGRSLLMGWEAGERGGDGILLERKLVKVKVSSRTDHSKPSKEARVPLPRTLPLPLLASWSAPVGFFLKNIFIAATKRTSFLPPPPLLFPSFPCLSFFFFFFVAKACVCFALTNSLTDFAVREL